MPTAGSPLLSLMTPCTHAVVVSGVHSAACAGAAPSRPLNRATRSPSRSAMPIERLAFTGAAVVRVTVPPSVRWDDPPLCECASESFES